MYQLVSKWLDGLDWDAVSEEVAAFCFILYDGCDEENWSMDLIGAERYDPEDSDWACDEVTDLGSRDPVFGWKKQAGWAEVQEEVVSVLGDYLEQGTYASILKSKAAVAVGVDDGDLEILYSK